MLTDERIKTIQEVFAGIGVLKMYAWEEPFKDYVRKVRLQVCRWGRG